MKQSDWLLIAGAGVAAYYLYNTVKKDINDTEQGLVSNVGGELSGGLSNLVGNLLGGNKQPSNIGTKYVLQSPSAPSLNQTTQQLVNQATLGHGQDVGNLIYQSVGGALSLTGAGANNALNVAGAKYDMLTYNNRITTNNQVALAGNVQALINNVAAPYNVEPNQSGGVNTTYRVAPGVYNVVPAQTNQGSVGLYASIEDVMANTPNISAYNVPSQPATNWIITNPSATPTKAPPTNTGDQLLNGLFGGGFS